MQLEKDLGLRSGNFDMQIMPGVFILGLINALLAYRDLMRAEGLKHIPILLEGH